MNITFSKIFFFIVVVIFAFYGTAWSIEVAPRISDREIIEKLTRLEEGQKGLRLEMDQRFDDMGKNINQRFEAVNQRFETVNQRFDDVNQRFNSLESLMMIMIAGIFGLIGFVIWDRKSTLNPLVKRLDMLEKQSQPDSNIQNPESPRTQKFPALPEELAIQKT